MENSELYQLLVKYGVDEKAAQQLQYNINGTDLIDLINSLKMTDLRAAVQQSNKILNRYGVSIHEGKMTKDFNHLYALYTGAKTNNYSNIIENLIPITESNRSEDHLLALEGFNYYTNLDGKLSEQLIDWLEENKVEFLTNGEGHFHIKCNDRDHAYKVGRTISGIVRKEHLVRDSNQSGDVMMRETPNKNSKSYINNLKKKITDVKPRDPNQELATKLQRTSGGPMDYQSQRKLDHDDKFGRNTKHKSRDFSEDIDYRVGESVMVKDQSATIKIPQGPDGTVGVVMDGKLSMVDYSDISRLDEAIMGGLTTISPLFRLRELAGLPPAPLSVPSDSIDDMSSLSSPDISSSTDMDSLGDIEEPHDDMEDMPDVDLDLTNSSELSTDHDDMMGPVDGGMPGDLPPDNPEIISGTVTPEASPAMSSIEASLGTIQQQLANITLGEYKGLVSKMQALSNQIQVMGRGYLGERRKK